MAFITTTKFVFDRTRLSAPQIADFLRERILSLEIAPGTPLSRAELQKAFGVSQTPVRDALLKLEEEGLVTTFPQYATLVSRVDMDHARQAHFMRRAIEADIVASLASDSSTQTLNDLRRANRRLKTEMDEQNYAEFLNVDRDFHWIMYRDAGLLDIWSMLRTRSGHLDRLRKLNLSNVELERIVQQHDLLVDAIEAGDPEKASRVLREHLSNTFTKLTGIEEQFPDYIA